MSYYRTCPICGAALDPGEVCGDCRDANREGTTSEQRDTALGATNTQSGKADKTVEKAVESASIISENQREKQV